MHISFGTSETVRASRLTLYLVNRDRDGEEIREFGYWVDRARRIFARLFSGSTAIPYAQGLWYARDKGAFIDERTAIVTSYVNTDEVIVHLDTLRTFFDEILARMRQEALAVEFDGELHFVYAREPSVCAAQPTMQ